MNLLFYLILFTVVVSVFIYFISNQYNLNSTHYFRDVESDNMDLNNVESPVDYDILNQIPEEKSVTDIVENFYDPENVTFPKPISKGDVLLNGTNCHWKMYKKPNYYGLGPWGKFHYGEPYYMKIRCQDNVNCNDDNSINLNCLRNVD